MQRQDSDDVYLWPDGSWCYRLEYECGDYGYKSDDFEIVEYACARWCALTDELPY